jgi:D-glycero-D-manno-heptose 1,7-bisphosphate phosphatase
MAMASKTVYLDLAGTIVLPLKPASLAEIYPIPGAIDAIAQLCSAGFRCPIITVQSRIEKGVFSELQFRDWFAAFAADSERHGAFIEGPYVCPHRFTTPCLCKKPNTLLYEKAADERNLQLAGSFVVGDTADDMEAASRIGGFGCLVRTGWAGDDAQLDRARAHTSFVGADLAEAVAWVLARAPA